jgi:hypothetical protein
MEKEKNLLPTRHARSAMLQMAAMSSCSIAER